MVFSLGGQQLHPETKAVDFIRAAIHLLKSAGGLIGLIRVIKQQVAQNAIFGGVFAVINS